MAQGLISNMCVSSLVAARNIMELIEIVGFEACIFAITTGVILVVRRFRKVRRCMSPRTGLADRYIERATKERPCAPAKKSEKPSGTHSFLTQQVELAIASRIPAVRALSAYACFRADGRHLHIAEILTADGSRHTAVEYFSALIQSAGRAGKADIVEQLLDDMKEAGVSQPLSIFESAMRLLAGKRFFREALSVYDRLVREGLEASPVTLSCLVGFAAEIDECDRAIEFFRRLEELNAVSMRAAMTVLRLFARRKDWPSSADVLRTSLRCCGSVDSILLNTALETAISVGKVSEAEAMLSEKVGLAVADVISYNIVLKGVAQQGNIEKGVELVAMMRRRGIEPTLITFNTVMDAAVRACRPRAAWRVLDMLSADAVLKPDKCTCTTLVKALRQESTPEQMGKVMDIAESVLPSCSNDLSGRLLSGILEAATRLPDGDVALRAFSKMRSLNLPIPGSEVRASAALAQTRDIEVCGDVEAYCDDSRWHKTSSRWGNSPVARQRGRS